MNCGGAHKIWEMSDENRILGDENKETKYSLSALFLGV